MDVRMLLARLRFNELYFDQLRVHKKIVQPPVNFSSALIRYSLADHNHIYQ